jgi:hypothetical protein
MISHKRRNPFGEQEHLYPQKVRCMNTIRHKLRDLFVFGVQSFQFDMDAIYGEN